MNNNFSHSTKNVDDSWWSVIKEVYGPVVKYAGYAALGYVALDAVRVVGKVKNWAGFGNNGYDSDDIGVAEPVRVEKSKKGSGFGAVAGMEKLKRKMTDEVIEPLRHPEKYSRYGISIPNGLLLYGPPGCGKTFFAKHLAEEIGFDFMFVTPAQLKSMWVNESQKLIADMFKEARRKAPCMIFIDEINELCPDRDMDITDMSRNAVNEMLAQMDRTGEKGIFVIGATNRPDQMDPAILRAGRFDNKYYVGTPDLESRKALFSVMLKSRPYVIDINIDEAAKLTEGYISADLSLIVNNASRRALAMNSQITTEILTDEIKATRPSLSAEDLRFYDHLHKTMSGSAGKPKSKVGFVQA